MKKDKFTFYHLFPKEKNVFNFLIQNLSPSTFSSLVQFGILVNNSDLKFATIFSTVTVYLKWLLGGLSVIITPMTIHMFVERLFWLANILHTTMATLILLCVIITMYMYVNVFDSFSSSLCVINSIIYLL